MSAANTEGIGNGSAEGSIKGPGNNRNIYCTLNGPHLVDCGMVTLATVANGESNYSFVRVWFPKELDSTDNYFVAVTIFGNSGAHSKSAAISIAQGGVAVEYMTTTYFDIVSGYDGEAIPPMAQWFLYKKNA